MKKWNIEVSKEMYDILARVFQLIGLETPRDITAEEMKKVLNKMSDIVYSTQEELFEPSLKIKDDLKVVNDRIKPAKKIKNALIISKTGIIRYQLKSILSNHNVEVFTIENQYRGLAEFVKRLYDLVVIDTADDVDEIFDVVREIKRISATSSLNTEIVVLVPPESDTIKDKLLSRGVDRFFEKKSNWYLELTNELNLPAKVNR
jgi:PleD family two-component response regulator